MALITPILRETAAFDANESHDFVFNVVGGTQVVRNRILIRNNVDNSIVFDDTVDTFEFKHTVVGGTLTNGIYYNASVQTFSASGDASAFSNTIQFFCYTKPTVVFTNIPLSSLIETSSFLFDAQYNQIEGEQISSYIFNLYNLQNTIVSTSGQVFLSNAGPPPTDFSYEFSGFEDNSTYYIECICQSVHATIVTTGKIEISIKHEIPNVYTVVSLENNECDGYITIRSNMVSIDGTSNPDPPIYIEDMAVDLIQDGAWVRWEQGYSISGDFTLGIWGRQFNTNSPVLVLRSEYNTTDKPHILTVSFREEFLANDETRYAFFDILVYSGGKIPYYAYSNRIPYPTPNEDLHFWIRRINNLYELKLGYYTSGLSDV